MENKKVLTKKILFFSGLGIDIAITIFLFVVAIIMLATYPGNNLPQAEFEVKAEANGAFIGYLQMHPTVYFIACVLPLFILLAINIVGLIIYVKKAGKKPEVQVSDLDAETKAALKAELLKDLNNENK